jgi:hypothetical protein
MRFLVAEQRGPGRKGRIILLDIFPAQVLAHGQTWQSATDRTFAGLID